MSEGSTVKVDSATWILKVACGVFFVHYCFDEWFAVLIIFCARSHDPHVVLLMRQEKCQQNTETPNKHDT